MVAAARRRFVEDGYGATTVASIAREAGVSVQTIYSSVGSKADLVVALLDVVRAEAGIQAVEASIADFDDPGALLVRGIHMQRELMERTGDIIRLFIDTAPSEPDVEAVWRGAMERSWAGVRETVARFHVLGALAPGLDPDAATVRLFVLGHPQTFVLLLDRGWDLDRIEAWLVDACRDALIARL